MDLLLTGVVALVALALLFDFSNGFHDAANSISTIVATRAMSTRAAVVLSAVCNFAALFFVGKGVANAVAGVVKPGGHTLTVTFAALIAAVAWNYLTWHFGMPSSSSHAIMGGLVGAGIAAGGLGVVNWGKVSQVGMFILIAPLLAFVVAIAGTGVVWLIQKAFRWRDNGVPFKGLQVVSAAWVSFGHGANDAQKTMGVIAALLAGAGYTGVGADGKILVPTWVGYTAYGAIALGTAWGGWRIVETMGLRLTRLNAKAAVAANLGAVVSMFTATNLSVPISTTHAAAASVVGAGVGARRGVNWAVIGRMVSAWVVTIPSAAVVGWLVYHASALPGVEGVAAIIVITVVFLLGVGWTMRNAFSAKDLASQLPSEDELNGMLAVPDETVLVAGRDELPGIGDDDATELKSLDEAVAEVAVLVLGVGPEQGAEPEATGAVAGPADGSMNWAPDTASKAAVTTSAG